MTNKGPVFIINTADLSNEPDWALEKIASAIYAEQDRRYEYKIELGEFAPLIQDEIDLVKAGAEIRAIMSYRNRTDCDVRFAKRVVRATCGTQYVRKS